MSHSKPLYDGHNRKPVKVSMHDLSRRRARRRQRRGVRVLIAEWRTNTRTTKGSDCDD